MSLITDYFLRGKCDHKGRTLNETVSWSDVQLEETHDFIQWWFPITEPSQFNPHAPILTKQDVIDITALRGGQFAIDKVVQRFLVFLDLVGNPFTSCPYIWETPNHNHLRITRMIKFLKLVGRYGQAYEIFGKIIEQYHADNKEIDPASLSYWQDALLVRSLLY